jgi:EmrB/QacA subfamily drug resistance transporter
MNDGNKAQEVKPESADGEKPSRAIPFVIGITFFMTGMDKTIIATAVPAIAKTFGANPVDLGIAIIAYIVSMAVFVPVSGWLADRLGTRTVFATAICIYISGSALSALSDSIWMLTMARILQGMGGALILPIGRMIIFQGRPKSEYAKAIVTVSLFPAIGMALGPVLGGSLITYASSWRWIFLLNVPLGLLILVPVFLFVKNVRQDNVKTFDWLGFIATGLFLSTFLYSIERIGRGGEDVWFSTALAVFALGVGVFAVMHARSKSNALMDFTLLRFKTVVAGTMFGTIFRTTVGAIPFLMPLLFQVVFGMSAFEAGLIVVALGCGIFTARIFIAKVLRMLGFRTLFIANAIFLIGSFVLCMQLESSTPSYLSLLLLFVIGMGQGCGLTTLNMITYSEVPQHRNGATASFAQVFQQMAQAMGVAVAVSALNIGLVMRDAVELTKSDFILAFSVFIALNVVAILLFARLPADVGHEVSGHKPKSLPKSGD